jgi:hypothetical protein
VAVVVSRTADQVAEMSFPAEGAPVGFAVELVNVGVPAAGSVEGALVDAGLDAGIALTGLRSPDPLTGLRSLGPLAGLRSPDSLTVLLDRLRSQGVTVETPFHQAVGVVVCAIAATKDSAVDF